MTLQQAYNRRYRLTLQLQNTNTAITMELSNPTHSASYLTNKMHWLDVLKGEVRDVDDLIKIMVFEEKRLSLMEELLDLKVLIANGDEDMITSVKELKQEYKEKLRRFSEMNEISIRRDKGVSKLKL